MTEERMKKLKERILRTRIEFRDETIQKLLDNDTRVVKTREERFKQEIIDHLEVCINRDEFITDEYFVNKNDFIIENTCNCKMIIETKSGFDRFLKILVSEYLCTSGDEFNIYDIIKER